MSGQRDTSGRWAEIEALFSAAMELPPDARRAFLDGIADDELRDDVESLVAHEAPEGALIKAAIGQAAAHWVATADAAVAARAIGPGRRLGAYEVTGVLGQGGMGTVYRARRADGQFDQDVAIKLVRHGFETSEAIDRFRRERQILAKLAHPSIARLLDGGTAIDETGAPIPYLVLEYVEGETITAFCAAHALAVADRVRLFRLVCAAVQYAHAQFIVHRDLKPPNILITSDGQPKLLDFGIAKLLGHESATPQTSTGMQLLTPDYASPEQVTGDRVTAATDVYALGALLYELLTGQKAHRFRTLSPVEIGRVVCDTQPLKPSMAVAETTPHASRLRRQLEGDLDTIVIKALQKDPSRRYQSVEQFSEDLRRHLQGLPVVARPDSFTYRTAKFVRRNRWPLAGATIVAASLVVGTVVSVWQARRAERRFDQVRTLASALIYDLHDEIKDLPGSTQARQKIVATGLQYLNGLEREAAGDPLLRRDLASAYTRIADVQGGVLESNLGDVRGALESYNKARSLLESDTSPDRVQQLVALDVKIGDALSYHGDVKGSLAAYARAQSLIEPLAAAPGVTSADLEQLAAVVQSIARVQGIARENTKSLESSQHLLEIRRVLLEKMPDNRVAIDNVAGAEAEVSMALQRVGRPRDALPHAQRSLALREQLAREQPNNVTAQRSLILSYSHVADILGNPTLPSLGDAAGAIEIYRKMTDVAERLAAADRSDQRAKWDLSNCLMRLGSALLESPARSEGIDRLQQAAGLMSEIAAAEPRNNRVRVSRAFVSVRIAQAIIGESGRTDEAIEHYTTAISTAEAVLAADPAEGSMTVILAQSLSGRGLALARAGRHDAALGDGRRAVEVAEQARERQRGNPRTVANLAAACAAMGRIHHARRTAADRATGCTWFGKSLDLYGQIPPAQLDAQTDIVMKAVSRDAARCGALE